MLKHSKHSSIITFHNVREVHSTNIVKKVRNAGKVHSTSIVKEVRNAGKVHSTSIVKEDYDKYNTKNINTTHKSGMSNPQTFMDKCSQCWGSPFHQPCERDPHECDSKNNDATNKQVWDVHSTHFHEQTTATARQTLFMFSHQTLSQDS